jgi:mannose-6-phosphate isomerase
VLSLLGKWFRSGSQRFLPVVVVLDYLFDCMEMYPLKFKPILKKILWGGSEIGRFKQMDIKESGIGESWEIAQMPDAVSVVANGAWKGRNLTELMETEPEALLGKSVYRRFGTNFPLLVKFIDAEADLSIQVHPNDRLAKERHDSFGKTEMWYVIGSKPGSKLISGFSQQIDAEEYERRIANSTIEEVLQSFEVRSGDVFFLPAGRVHAIGAGIFIAEIQQSSNITYRLYDYHRKDVQGKERELHTELAKDAIDFRLYQDLKTNYKPLENKVIPLVSCSYFTTNRISLKAGKSGVKTIKIPDGRLKVQTSESIEMDRDYSTLDSFVIFVCMKGEGQLRYGRKTLSVKQGETLLVPASMERVVISTTNELLLLETYILS